MALRRTKRETPVTAEQVEATVPPSLRVAGAYSWRILLVVGVVAVVIFAIAQLKDIVVPFMIAILLSALGNGSSPARARVPRTAGGSPRWVMPGIAPAPPSPL